MLKNKNIPTLVTIGPSHYCEKVRWAMDFLNIDFKEESYPPFFHILGTSKLGGRTVPILVTDQVNYKDSTDILKYLDSLISEPILYPLESKKEVEELEELFDIKLGPSTRRVAYSHLLYAPEIIFEDFCDSSHPFQDSMYQTFFPVFKILIKKALKVTPEDTEKSRARIDDVFNIVKEKLSDGRKFLTGDKITAADLTFASLASPVIMPENYKVYKLKDKLDADLNTDMTQEEKIDYADQMPKDFSDEIKAYRNTKAGQFVEFMYSMRI